MKETEKILNFLSLIPVNYNNINKYEMNTINGKIVVTGLINNNKMSIAEMKVSDNTYTDWHTHDETEHFILYNGDGYCIEYINTDNSRIKRKVNKHDNCYVLPNTPHRLVDAIGDSRSIVILIPGSEYYPKGKI